MFTLEPLWTSKECFIINNILHVIQMDFPLEQKCTFTLEPSIGNYSIQPWILHFPTFQKRTFIYCSDLVFVMDGKQENLE